MGENAATSRRRHGSRTGSRALTLAPPGLALAAILATMLATLTGAPLAASSAGPTVRLAVMEFTTAGNGPEIEGMGVGLQSMITTDLSNVASLALVERARLRDVASELKLAKSGLVDAATAARVGRVVGATHLLTGSVTVAGKKMRLDARLVQVSTGIILMGESSEGQADVFFELEKALVRKLVDTMSVQVTPKERGALAKIQTADLEAFRKYGLGLRLFDQKKYDPALKALRQAADRDADFGLARTTLTEYERMVSDLLREASTLEQDRMVEAQRELSREMLDEQKVITKLFEVAGRKGDAARDARLTALYLLARQYDRRAFKLAGQEDRFAWERTTDMLFQRYLAESLSAFPRFPALINNFDSQGWWKFRMPEVATFDADLARLVGELKDYGVQTKHKDDEQSARRFHRQRCLTLDRQGNADRLHLDVRTEAELDDRLDALLAKHEPDFLRREPTSVFERIGLRRSILDLDAATKLIVGLRGDKAEPAWLRKLADQTEMNIRVKRLIEGKDAPGGGSKLAREMVSLRLAGYGDISNQRTLDNLDRDQQASFGPAGALTPRGARELTGLRSFSSSGGASRRNGREPEVTIGGHVVWNVEGQLWTGPRSDPRRAEEMRYFKEPAFDPKYDRKPFALLLIDGVPRRDQQARFQLAFDDRPADFNPTDADRRPRRAEGSSASDRPLVTFIFGVRDIHRLLPKDEKGNPQVLAPMHAMGLRIDGGRVELVDLVRQSHDPNAHAEPLILTSKPLATCPLARGAAAAARSIVDVSVRIEGARAKLTVGEQTCELAIPKPQNGFYGFVIERPGYAAIRELALGGLRGSD
jgi:TolB-like protein